MVIVHLRRTHCKTSCGSKTYLDKLNHLHDLYILDETAFLDCMSDVCVYMCICYNLGFYFMFYVFSRIYYVSRGPHGRMAILAKCVTLLKYCIGVGRFRILGWGQCL